MNEKLEKVEKLEKALAELRRAHRDAWDMYGSELCAGDMIRQEEKLEEEIKQLRAAEGYHIEDPKYIIDD